MPERDLSDTLEERVANTSARVVSGDLSDVAAAESVPRDSQAGNSPENELHVTEGSTLDQSSVDSIQETFQTDGEASVEVLTNSSGAPRIFEKPKLKYQLMAADVPDFANATWRECFERLTDDIGVVGWIAFQDRALGASDRQYDEEFVDVLADYRQTLERLRNEVGLSKIQEASIVGEEGKMWFITAVDDVWFALFVERTTDIEELSHRLFDSLQLKLTT